MGGKWLKQVVLSLVHVLRISRKKYKTSTVRSEKKVVDVFAENVFGVGKSVFAINIFVETFLPSSILKAENIPKGKVVRNYTG